MKKKNETINNGRYGFLFKCWQTSDVCTNTVFYKVLFWRTTAVYMSLNRP